MVPSVFNVGAATKTPSVAALYQVTVCPGTGVIAVLASRVCIGDALHSVMLPVEIGAAGEALIVKVTAVLVNDVHVPLLD